jgi:hypothetical protein
VGGQNRRGRRHLFSSTALPCPPLADDVKASLQVTSLLDQHRAAAAAAAATAAVTTKAVAYAAASAASAAASSSSSSKADATAAAASAAPSTTAVAAAHNDCYDDGHADYSKMDGSVLEASLAEVSSRLQLIGLERSLVLTEVPEASTEVVLESLENGDGGERSGGGFKRSGGGNGVGENSGGGDSGSAMDGVHGRRQRQQGGMVCDVALVVFDPCSVRSIDFAIELSRRLPMSVPRVMVATKADLFPMPKETGEAGEEEGSKATSTSASALAAAAGSVAVAPPQQQLPYTPPASPPPSGESGGWVNGGGGGGNGGGGDWGFILAHCADMEIARPLSTSSELSFSSLLPMPSTTTTTTTTTTTYFSASEITTTTNNNHPFGVVTQRLLLAALDPLTSCAVPQSRSRLLAQEEEAIAQRLKVKESKASALAASVWRRRWTRAAVITGGILATGLGASAAYFSLMSSSSLSLAWSSSLWSSFSSSSLGGQWRALVRLPDGWAKRVSSSPFWVNTKATTALFVTRFSRTFPRFDS